jgi:hypothetical protein
LANHHHQRKMPPQKPENGDDDVIAQALARSIEARFAFGSDDSDHSVDDGDESAGPSGAAQDAGKFV